MNIVFVLFVLMQVLPVMLFLLYVARNKVIFDIRMEAIEALSKYNSSELNKAFDSNDDDMISRTVNILSNRWKKLNSYTAEEMFWSLKKWKYSDFYPDDFLTLNNRRNNEFTSK